jgi:hypothetical protein
VFQCTAYLSSLKGSYVRDNVINGRLWQPAKYPPYKHGTAACGGNMADIIGAAAYDGRHKIRNAIMPWQKFDNTGEGVY